MNLLGKFVFFLVISKLFNFCFSFFSLKFSITRSICNINSLLVSSINEIVESAPGRGGGGGRGGGSSGKSNSSTGGKRSGYYLHGGLYTVSRTVKETPVKTPVYRGIGAWGIIGIVLAVLVTIYRFILYQLFKLNNFTFSYRDCVLESIMPCISVTYIKEQTIIPQIWLLKLLT